MTASALDPLVHFQVFRALLSTLPVSITLYQDDIPETPSFPYAVLRMSTGTESAERLCVDSNAADFWAWLTCVGTTGDSARVVARETRARLVDARPVVAGRTCTPIRKESSLTIQPDRDVVVPGTNLHPLYGVDGYHFISRAA